MASRSTASSGRGNTRTARSCPPWRTRNTLPPGRTGPSLSSPARITIDFVIAEPIQEAFRAAVYDVLSLPGNKGKHLVDPRALLLAQSDLFSQPTTSGKPEK